MVLEIQYTPRRAIRPAGKTKGEGGGGGEKGEGKGGAECGIGRGMKGGRAVW